MRRQPHVMQSSWHEDHMQRAGRSLGSPLGAGCREPLWVQPRCGPRAHLRALRLNQGAMVEPRTAWGLPLPGARADWLPADKRLRPGSSDLAAQLWGGARPAGPMAVFVWRAICHAGRRAAAGGAGGKAWMAPAEHQLQVRVCSLSHESAYLWRHPAPGSAALLLCCCRRLWAARAGCCSAGPCLQPTTMRHGQPLGQQR